MLQRGFSERTTGRLADQAVRDRLIGPQVDIFSFGVIMYEIFARSMTLAVILSNGSPLDCEVYAYKVPAPTPLLMLARACPSRNAVRG